MLIKINFFGSKFNNEFVQWQRSPDFQKLPPENLE